MNNQEICMNCEYITNIHNISKSLCLLTDELIYDNDRCGCFKRKTK